MNVVKIIINRNGTSTIYTNNKMKAANLFNPPHLLRTRENSFLRTRYEVLPADWKKSIRKGFENEFRILRDKKKAYL